MSEQKLPPIDEIRELLTDFGLPAMIMIIAFILIFCGKDGEVKTILAMAAGWIFKSGFARGQKKK